MTNYDLTREKVTDILFNFKDIVPEIKQGFEEIFEEIKERYTKKKLNHSIEHCEKVLEDIDLDLVLNEPDDYEIPVYTDGIKEYYTAGYFKEKYKELVDYKKMLNVYNDEMPQKAEDLMKTFFTRYFDDNYFAYSKAIDIIEKNPQMFEKVLQGQKEEINLQADYKELAEPLTEAEYNNLSPLEKKAVDIVQDMDFEVYSFKDEKGEKFYCLYDLQRECIYDYSIEPQDFRESAYVVNDLKGLTQILPDDYYEDYNYDIEKVFDDEVKNMQDCFNDEPQELSQDTMLENKLSQLNEAEKEQKQRISEHSLQNSSTNEEHLQSQEVARKRKV